VNNLHLRTLQRFLQSLEPVLCVLDLALADEDHNLSTLRQSFLDEFTRLAASGSIVGAQVKRAVAVGCVAVLSDDQHAALRRVVNDLLLSSRIDHANRNSVSASLQRISNVPILFLYG